MACGCNKKKKQTNVVTKNNSPKRPMPLITVRKRVINQNPQKK